MGTYTRQRLHRKLHGGKEKRREEKRRTNGREMEGRGYGEEEREPVPVADADADAQQKRSTLSAELFVGAAVSNHHRPS